MKTRNQLKIYCLTERRNILLLFTFVISIGAHAQNSHFYSQKGLAIRGFDPVAYFTEQKAVEGSEQHQLPWNGVVWQFKSEENLQLFKNNPDSYAPQYGGWCAYGVSENHKSPTDPYSWTIIDDKLYLNYNPKVKEKWKGNTEQCIQRANVYWNELKEK
jgi:YHS domain-containing protein